MLDCSITECNTERDILNFLVSNKNETFSVSTLTRRFSEENYTVSKGTVNRYVNKYFSSPTIKPLFKVYRSTINSKRMALHFKCIGNNYINTNNIYKVYMESVMGNKFEAYDTNTIHRDIFEAILSFGNGKAFSGTELHKKVLEKHPGFVHKSLSYYVTKTIKIFNLKDKLYKVKKGTSVHYLYDDGKSVNDMNTDNITSVNDTCVTDTTSKNETVVIAKDTSIPHTYAEENIELVLDKLMDSVQEAGGRCSDFTKDKLSAMNALDFIMTIHRNMDVEFKYKKK